jgi:hypothetical protein
MPTGDSSFRSVPAQARERESADKVQASLPLEPATGFGITCVVEKVDEAAPVRRRPAAAYRSRPSNGRSGASSRGGCLPPSRIFLCWRHPSPREKRRRWEARGPQNALQGSEVLIAHVGQIRSRIDLNRLGRLAVAAIKDGLCGRNASRCRRFRVRHDCA